MGYCGLSFDDARRLRFDEAEAVLKAKNDSNREPWERARVLAAIMVQPHCKNRIKPKDLLPLPWDTDQKQKQKAPSMTREQAEARYRELIKKNS